MLKFAIIGAGAGGQSMAAILTSKGYIAKLYDIDKEKIHRLQELKTIKVTGVIACEAAPAVITDRIDEVMDDVDVIMVVSTTDAHRSIAYACKPYLKDGQIVKGRHESYCRLYDELKDLREWNAGNEGRGKRG